MTSGTGTLLVFVALGSFLAGAVTLWLLRSPHHWNEGNVSERDKTPLKDVTSLALVVAAFVLLVIGTVPNLHHDPVNYTLVGIGAGLFLLSLLLDHGHRLKPKRSVQELLREHDEQERARR